MPSFALIKDGTTVLAKYVFDLQPVDIPHKGFSWLPFVESYPPFNALTETLNSPTERIEATRVFKTATVRLLTAQELDTIRGDQVDDVQRVIFEALFNHENRIRALESKAPITRPQMLAALKALI